MGGNLIFLKIKDFSKAEKVLANLFCLRKGACRCLSGGQKLGALEKAHRWEGVGKGVGFTGLLLGKIIF